MTTVEVHADRTYPVVVRDGARYDLQNHLGGATRVAIIHQPALRTAGEMLRRQLIGVQAITVEIPDAEQAKTADVLAFCWNALGASGFTRNDVVVSLGGGATTDLAGFVAATWLRGIRVVHVPTTLLGMVDAAVGGKTGINTAEGKNLVGAFHSPVGVVCDLNALASLPRNDLLAGFAEVVKVGFTSDRTILDDVLRDVDASTDPSGALIGTLVQRAVQVKADVVSADFRETSATSGGVIGREVLNYGHTFGHAVEKAERYRWRHGAAVSVGMSYVAELARIGGRLSDADADLHTRVLTTLGLPTTYPGGRWEQLLPAIAVDKKARGSLLRFVILTGIGKPAIWEGPDPTLLVAAYDAISS